MKTLAYLIGIAVIFNGILHLLIPNRWDALWVVETRKLLPDLGNLFARWYRQYPMKRRVQGLGWIALGASMLWVAGTAESD